MGVGGCCWCWDGGVGERCSLIGIDGVKERGGSVVVVGGGEGVEKGDGGRLRQKEGYLRNFAVWRERFELHK